jgi:hypothetical protein
MTPRSATPSSNLHPYAGIFTELVRGHESTTVRSELFIGGHAGHSGGTAMIFKARIIRRLCQCARPSGPLATHKGELTARRLVITFVPTTSRKLEHGGLTPADADAIVATAMRALASLIQCPCPVSSPYGPLIGQDSHIGPDAMALAAPPLLPMRRPR